MRLSWLLMLAAVVASACGGSPSRSLVSPATGPGNALSLTGSWSGSSSDTTGSDQIVCTLTQNGSTITGTMSLSDNARGMMGRGSMQGTMTGNRVTFHMNVPTGGFSGAMGPCSMGVDAVVDVSDDGRSMTGTYGGAMSGMMAGMMSQPQSCGGVMSNGRLTLTR